MEQKSNFYLFLDIDGVMNDWDYIISEVNAGRMKKGQSIKSFKPESVNALNHLIEELSKKYNFQLVISSTWRMDMEETTEVFKKHNIIGYDKLDSTPRRFDPHERGKEIIEYLEKHNFNENQDDFLIIDDETFDYDKYFTDDKLIKTEIFHNALSFDMVNKYLKEHQNINENNFEM